MRGRLSKGNLLIPGSAVLLLLLAFWYFSALREQRLVELDGSVSPRYQGVLVLEDGAHSQEVSFIQGGITRSVAVRDYANAAKLGLEDWVRQSWDPTLLLRLEPVPFPSGAALRVADSSAWLAAHPDEADFPALIVVSSGGRILVVDRLNGAPLPGSAVADFVGLIGKR